MKRSDIVRIRSTAGRDDQLLDRLNGLKNEIVEENNRRGLEAVYLFRHEAFSGDFMIQLLWKGAKTDIVMNQTIHYLKEYLQEYGLLDHSVWIEQTGAGRS